MTFDVFGHLHAYMQPCVHGNRSMHTWLLVTRTGTVSYVVNYSTRWTHIAAHACMNVM